MDEQLDIQQITEKLKNAFPPYRCTIEMDDYQNLVFLKILDKNGDLIFQTPSVNADSIDESKLHTLIERTKETIGSKGYIID